MYFDERSDEELSISPEQASPGAPLTFWDSMRQSYDYEKLVESQYGVAADLIEQEQEMQTRIRRAGGTPPPSYLTRLGPSGDFESIPRADKLAQALASGDRRTYEGLVKTYDEELERLKGKYPDAEVKTFAEMFEDTKQRFATLSKRQQRGTSWGGTAGSFIGGMGASLQPDANPLSVATLPVGGFGRSALTRILTEGAAQAGVQGIEEITGVRANKRLLGLDPDWSESLANVGMAAVFGSSLQTLGEGAVGVGRTIKRRWFQDTSPMPPVYKKGTDLTRFPSAPEVVPGPGAGRAREPIRPEIDDAITRAVQETVGTSKNYRRGAATDYNHVQTHLLSYSGLRPWEITPPTHTRPLMRPDDPKAPAINFNDAGRSVDDIAREIDPVTFKQYDQLQLQLSQSRGFMDHAMNKADDAALERARTELSTFNDELDRLEAQLEGAGKKKRQTIEAQIRDVQEARATREAALLKLGPSNAEAYRGAILKVNEQIRDLEPALERAYSRAQNRWAGDEAIRGSIRKMIRNNEQTIAPVTEMQGPPKPDILDKAMMAALRRTELIDVVPELRAGRGENETAMDVVNRVHADSDKDIDAGLDAFKSQIPRLLADETGEIEIDMGDLGKLRLDDTAYAVADRDGKVREVTVREMLEDVQSEDEIVQAATVCSVVKAS